MIDKALNAIITGFTLIGVASASYFIILPDSDPCSNRQTNLDIRTEGRP